MEPRAPEPSLRVKAIEELIKDASIRVVVRVDPIIPGLTDGENLFRILSWLCRARPFAACFETMRIDSHIASRLRAALDKSSFDNLMSFYGELGDEPVHPELNWRLALFEEAKRILKPAGIRASFCRASLPRPMTKWDCRGGF